MKLVLLIEDDHLNRKLLRDILGMKFRVLEANSAESALSLLTDHNPDAIFLDIQLPGMDGIALLRLLKADPRTAAIPVIGLSAMAYPNDVKNGRDNGCLEYVTKPIVEEPYPFVERMEKLLEQQHGQQLPHPSNDMATHHFQEKAVG